MFRNCKVLSACKTILFLFIPFVPNFLTEPPERAASSPLGIAFRLLTKHRAAEISTADKSVINLFSLKMVRSNLYLT